MNAGEYQGRDMAARLLAAVIFRPGRTFRLITTSAFPGPCLAPTRAPAGA